MALRDILTKKDPQLRRISREVTDFGGRTQRLIDDLMDTVEDAYGLGLAAPQVGVLRRAVVIYDGENFRELINPVITERSGEVVHSEACLSVPGEAGIVARPQKVTVEAQDRRGRHFSLTAEDMTARCICHELDHLDGILYTDIASRMLSEEELGSDVPEDAADGENKGEPDTSEQA